MQSSEQMMEFNNFVSEEQENSKILEIQATELNEVFESEEELKDEEINKALKLTGVLNLKNKNLGINLINKGRSIAPPGSINTVKAGILLQISSNCSLTFSFSSSLDSFLLELIFSSRLNLAKPVGLKRSQSN